MNQPIAAPVVSRLGSHPPDRANQAQRQSLTSEDSDMDSQVDDVYDPDGFAQGQDEFAQDPDEQDVFDPVDQEHQRQSNRLKDMFSHQRVSPILTEIRDMFNLSLKIEEGSSDSDSSTQIQVPMFLGNVGVSVESNKPILRLPSQIRKEKEKVFKTKWRPNPPKTMKAAFRVSESDYNVMLKVPPLDPEVVKILPKVGPSNSKPFSFSPYWEKELMALNEHIMLQTRISSFQFLLLNFLISQINDDSQSEPTGVAATAKLLVDI